MLQYKANIGPTRRRHNPKTSKNYACILAQHGLNIGSTWPQHCRHSLFIYEFIVIQYVCAYIYIYIRIYISIYLSIYLVSYLSIYP